MVLQLLGQFGLPYLPLNIVIFVFPVLLLATIFFIQNCYRNQVIKSGLPVIPLHLFNVIGHLALVPRRCAVFSDYPKSVYLFQLICGLAKLFPNHQLFGLWLAYSFHIVVVKAHAAEEVLRSTSLLTKSWTYEFLHPWLGTGLLTSNGTKWKSRRKLLTSSFHFEILKNFLPVFNEQSQVLLEVLNSKQDEPWIDLHHVTTLCSLDIICESTLGVKIDAQKNSDSEYVKSVLRISELIIDRLINPSLWSNFIYFNTKTGYQFKKDLNILHNFTNNAIHTKKKLLLSSGIDKNKRKAFMDLLLEHNMLHEDLTDEDVREEVDTFAFEGHDTTSAGLTWTLYLIGLYPDVQMKVHEELDMIFQDDRHATIDDIREMKYLECVIKESQRLYPSVPLFQRVIDKDVTISGYRIPKGTVCVVNTYLLHRDETVFPNPEVFDPDRFSISSVEGRHPYAYVPFSAGPRNCIGQKFALMELKAVLSTVLRKYVIKSLQPRDKINSSTDLILRPVQTIKVKIFTRN